MAEDSAARRARDSALLVKAASYNGVGIAALDLAVPLLMADLRSQDAERRRTAHSATEGPWLLGVRDLARVLCVTPAQRAFRRADQCYWSLVLHWLPMISGMARVDEVRYHLPVGDLQGLYSEIGYHVSIRLDPERAVFGTYFNSWLKSFIGRAPELQSLVHETVSVKGLSARLTLRSFDEPDTEGSSGAARELDGALAVTDERYDYLDLYAAKGRIVSRMNERNRKLFQVFCQHDNGVTAGEVLGVSRERARQLRNAVIAKGTAIVYERVSP